MFTKEQFDHLHSLWDGSSSSPSVCATCEGKCCDNIAKTLIPGEYEYVIEKSGQHNSSWCSKGCLCDTLKTVKPVICKTYPLSLYVDSKGFKVFKENIFGGYSNDCKLIKFDPAKYGPFLDYLFSDVDTRLFWMLTFTLESTAEFLQKDFKKAGFPIATNESIIRAMHDLVYTPYDDHDVLYKKLFVDEVVYEKTY